jgi:hypothetical protein
VDDVLQELSISPQGFGQAEAQPHLPRIAGAVHLFLSMQALIVAWFYAQPLGLKG